MLCFLVLSRFADFVCLFACLFSDSACDSDENQGQDVDFNQEDGAASVCSEGSVVKVVSVPMVKPRPLVPRRTGEAIQLRQLMYSFIPYCQFLRPDLCYSDARQMAERGAKTEFEAKVPIYDRKPLELPEFQSIEHILQYFDLAGRVQSPGKSADNIRKQSIRFSADICAAWLSYKGKGSSTHCEPPSSCSVPDQEEKYSKSPEPVPIVEVKPVQQEVPFDEQTLEAAVYGNRARYYQLEEDDAYRVTLNNYLRRLIIYLERFNPNHRYVKAYHDQFDVDSPSADDVVTVPLSPVQSEDGDGESGMIDIYNVLGLGGNQTGDEDPGDQTDATNLTSATTDVDEEVEQPPVSYPASPSIPDEEGEPLPYDDPSSPNAGDQSGDEEEEVTIESQLSNASCTKNTPVWLDTLLD